MVHRTAGFRQERRQAIAASATAESTVLDTSSTPLSSVVAVSSSGSNTPTSDSVPASSSATLSSETSAPASSSSSSSSSSSLSSRTTPSSSSSSSSTTTSSSSSSSATSASSTSIVTQIITPTTVITIGTSTYTSTYAPTTLTSGGAVSNNSTSSGLSSGARTGIIVGCVVGGLALIAVALFGCCAMRRKRRHDQEAKDNIIWPAIAQNPDDRAALYPEVVHPTGRSGIGGDEMEEAGLGGGMAGAGRWNSQSSGGHEPTLPSFPPSIYSDQGAYGGQQPNSGYSSSASPYSPPSSGYGYSASNQSHAPLAPGPASIDYHRSTPSPPRSYPPGAGPTSSNGHSDLGSSGGAGALPLPGSEVGHEEIGRPLSPTPMQVGGAFGHGYDESNGGKGWRLSVVNDDRDS